jgi:uncharacterized protein YjbJ (UPF0337 family)
MNREILRGKWNEMKGDLKSKWGNLTDDDFTRINGDRDKLIGILQQRYGRHKDEITREVDTFLTQYETTHRKVS